MSDTVKKFHCLSLPLQHISPEVSCAQDYELMAKQFLAETHYAYIAGGSGRDVSCDANSRAFNRYALLPRILHDVNQGHTGLQFMEKKLAHPVILAPVAYQMLAHPHGELETARAAEATDTILTCSTLSSVSLEEVGSRIGSDRWFQLYMQPDRDITVDLVRRAESSGYSAIMVTLDAAIQMPSLAVQRKGFVMPTYCKAVNLHNYRQVSATESLSGQSRVFQEFMRHAVTKDNLIWLLKTTTLPVIAKGVLHPDDARELISLGIAGIVVSNHGGRTVDGVSAALDCLPMIREAVGKDYPLIFDSGIRSGSDIFKAIALGADAVMIGRLQMYALSVAGALGVAHMIRLLREELEICMAVTGCASLLDIVFSSLRKQD